MKQIIKWTSVVLLAGLVGLTLAVVFVAGVQGQHPLFALQGAIAQSSPYPRSGLEDSGEWGADGANGESTLTPKRPFPSDGWEPVPGYAGWAMMDPGMHGYGREPRTSPNPGEPITLDQATEAVRKYLDTSGDPDLTLAEVMEFSDNFYAQVKEKSTGIHAFELLIDRHTGSVYPEMGPNMMWKTKYGHMGGWISSVGAMTVTPNAALAASQQWLDANLPGTSVADEADTFYGYYTIHMLTDGQVSGMLSVNGYTSQIWFHTWHGTFLGMQSLEENLTDLKTGGNRRS